MKNLTIDIHNKFFFNDILIPYFYLYSSYFFDRILWRLSSQII